MIATHATPHRNAFSRNGASYKIAVVGLSPRRRKYSKYRYRNKPYNTNGTVSASRCVCRAIRAIVDQAWKYGVYYDPFGGEPTEYEMYDLTNDPLEMKNLAHAAHSTPESDVERARLHQKLSDVMRENGTAPDSVVATHSTDGRVDNERAVCAYPQVARYTGPGDANDAANWKAENFTCR